MISELEMSQRVYIKRRLINGKLKYLVIVDGEVVLETANKKEAYAQQRMEKDRLSIEEALYDAELKIRPEKLKAKQNEARRYVMIKNPDIYRDFPIAWKVYYGPVLIGSYYSRWEAEQYRDYIIMNGGY